MEVEQAQETSIANYSKTDYNRVHLNTINETYSTDTT